MNLDYIDRAVETAVKAEFKSPKLSGSQRESAKTKATKNIAGFNIHDEEAEKKALDEMIAARRKVLAAFRKDRSEVREKLEKLGAKALAVVPTGAWNKMCLEAGLFMFHPRAGGAVRADYRAFDGFKPTAFRTKEQLVADFSKKDWRGFLLKLFPNQMEAAQGQHYDVHLELPQPPADVTATLVKVQSLPLRLAVQAEAIGFRETQKELVDRAKEGTAKDDWAKAQGYTDYADWLKRDPIVYTEHGSVSAIIAQFGDFPIEKEIVDRVVNGDDLIPEKNSVDETRYLSGASTYTSQFVTPNQLNQLNQLNELNGLTSADIYRQQEMIIRMGRERLRQQMEAQSIQALYGNSLRGL